MLLIGMPHAQEYILTWANGTPVRQDYICKAYHRLRMKLGIEVRFHDLRHTHATMLLENGTSPKVIAERLGHADIRTTLNIYAHVTQNMQDEAAALMDSILK